MAAETDPNAWRVNPTGISAAVKALFPKPIRIGAMEDAAEDAAKFKTSTTIGRLIGEIMQSVAANHAASFQPALDALRECLDADGSARATDLTQFDQQATAAVADYFPGISVKIHVPTPEIEDLFKSGTISTYEGTTRREFSSLGHGAQRSIQMALIRVLAERQRTSGTGSSRTLLLIDEPELYLHPQGIEQARDSLEALAGGRYQVVFSTHSPVFVGREHVDTTCLVTKGAASGTVVRPSVGSVVSQAIADAPSQARVLMSLNHSSRWLFAERILLVEGETENRILPELYNACTASRFRSSNVAMVAQGGVDGLKKMSDVLLALQVPWKAIVDLDFAFKGAVAMGLFAGTDPDIVQGKVEMARLAAVHGVCLDAEGRPKKGNGRSAAEGYSMMASDPQFAVIVDRLHQRLLNSNIWVWKLGAIEKHLNLSGKKEQHWAQFLSDLKANGLGAVVPDEPGIRDFVAWIDTP